MRRKFKKSLKKGDIPAEIMKRFHNAFLSLDLTKDLNLFDVNYLMLKR
ncbi:MAG TPA: hypothetical protein PLX22_04650 [Spirochaetota bacterium]|nr:hypothetical protein [Spirochaetota bacterium]HQG43603.1 hypothetical protein [Spirochaetota bacterium]